MAISSKWLRQSAFNWLDNQADFLRMPNHAELFCIMILRRTEISIPLFISVFIIIYLCIISFSVSFQAHTCIYTHIKRLAFMMNWNSVSLFQGKMADRQVGAKKKRGPYRAKYTQADVEKCIIMHTQHKWSIRKCERLIGVPATTISDKLHGTT